MIFTPNNLRHYEPSFALNLSIDIESGRIRKDGSIMYWTPPAIERNPVFTMHIQMTRQGGILIRHSWYE